MALRIKNHWFREDHPRSAEEVAGAAAFIVWRVGFNVPQNMRRADFDILPGAQYFDFLAEWRVFLIQVADRIAYTRMTETQRQAFTTPLARRVAEIYADNRADLLGARVDPGAPVAAPGRSADRDHFIDLLNLRSQDYADFDIDAARLTHPVARFLAERLIHVLGQRDRMWVHDQVMEIEAPDAAAHFGLHRLDSNWLADDEGVSHLQVQPGIAAGMDYIPYTNRALGWHTDGYYNPGDRQVHAMLLHCVRPAASGGANRLLDPALAAALLMQRDAALAAALFHPEAMSIPARMEADGSERPRQTGPVLRVLADGALHMRYTARTVSIDWRADDATRAAAAALRDLLADPATPVLQARLQPGWGLICANVLHDRSAFIDDPAAPRLIYRARFLDGLCGMA